MVRERKTSPERAKMGALGVQKMSSGKMAQTTTLGILAVPLVLEGELLALAINSALVGLVILGGMVSYGTKVNPEYALDPFSPMSTRKVEKFPTVFKEPAPRFVRYIINNKFLITVGALILCGFLGGQIASFSADDSSWMPLNCAVMFFWTVLALSPRILRHGYDKKVKGGEQVLGVDDVVTSCWYARFPMGCIDGATRRFPNLARMYQDFGHIVYCTTEYYSMPVYCHPHEFELSNNQRLNIESMGVLECNKKHRIRDSVLSDEAKEEYIASKAKSWGELSKDLFQYCREQQQAASNADVDIHDVMVNELEDVIAVHDFEHMVKRQVSTLFRNFWNFFVRFDHHVFVDMLILRAQFPHIFEMMADKLGQLTYMKEKTKSMPQMKNLKFSRIHNQENLIETLQRLEDEPDWDTEVFLKPRTGAFGEDSRGVSLRGFLEHGSIQRNEFMLCEQYLHCHRDILVSLKTLNVIRCVKTAAISLRVWSKRFRRRVFMVSEKKAGTKSRVAAMLVGEDGAPNSNGNLNQSFKVQKLSEDLDPEPVYGIKIGQNTVEIPLFRDVLTYADGIHDSVPMLPMLGIDFMVCDDGVYFMEANPMCSYSRYVPTLGNFYSLQEVEDYLDSLPFMDEQLRQSEMKGLKFFPDEPVAA